jgi:hypothetical protein
MNFSESQPDIRSKLILMLSSTVQISPKHFGKPSNATGKNRSPPLPYSKFYISLFLLTPFEGQLGFKHNFQDCFPLSCTLITGHPQLLQGLLNGVIEPLWGSGKVTLHLPSK